MSNDNLQLYTELMALSTESEAFYYVDQNLDGVDYRIFLYRLASYSDFLKPSALESRGIMFRMHNAILVCRPMEKFFNYQENPFTMDLDISAPDYIVDKVDGSLISSFIHVDASGVNSLRLKSKGSLFSEQAQAALQLLTTPEFVKLCSFVAKWTDLGYTVNMEYTSPANRIVIGYAKPSLTVLNVRKNDTGAYIPLAQLKDYMIADDVIDFLVKDFTPEYKSDMSKFIADVPDMTGIEGFVVRLMNGLSFKLKTRAYLALHHAKDSINSQRRLFEAVVMESADDLRSLFVDDTVSLQLIDEMQEKVSKLYNNMVKSVEDFFHSNKELDRKSYAIKGQNELDRKFFSLAMMKFLGKDVDYKGFMLKSYKEFGIRDELTELVLTE